MLFLLNNCLFVIYKLYCRDTIFCVSHNGYQKRKILRLYKKIIAKKIPPILHRGD